MENIEQLEADVRRAEKHLRDLREKKEAAEADEIAKRQEPLRALAERAHDLCCTYNHTDGCGWGYEKDSWSGSSHKRWLNKMENLFSDKGTYNTPAAEQIAKILDLVEQMREVHPRALYILGKIQSSY